MTRRFVYFSAFLCCLASFMGESRLRAEIKSAAGKEVKLERLPDGKHWLKPPQALAGKIDIAKTPPKVDFAVFPGQWEGARLWSSWGDALFASDGKYYASIGDHAAPHGTAYVYSIDSGTGKVQQVVDYNAVLGKLAADPDKYTPGKIHGGLAELADGWIYFFGYRGSVRQTGEESGYQGDWLLRYQTSTGKTENLGIPVEDCSVPVLIGHAQSRSLYGLAVPGKTARDDHDRFFHFSAESGQLIHVGGLVPNMSRAMIVTDDGRAYFSHNDEKTGQGIFVRYNPQTNKLEKTDTAVPGSGALRAASRPDAEGDCYCFTKEGVVFAFNTKTEKVRALTEAFVAPPMYTATCRLDPTERYVYYLPGAHGRTSAIGTPVVQLDVQTKHRKVIAFLNAPIREQKKYNVGGTYGIALNEDGSQLFINFNGAPLGNKQPDFALCSAIVVHIPASERP